MSRVPAHPGFGLERYSSKPKPGDGSLKQYPFMPWDELYARIQWKQGEHVLAIGGSGSGKSTLMGVMLRVRDYVVVFVSKGFDETLAGPLFKTYETYQNWPPKKKHHKVILWPANGKDVQETRENKRNVFREATNDILLHRGHWCEAYDELHYMADSLKLSDEITDTEEQGRSYNITIWGNTQRPANIPLACYTNAIHGFFFLTQEEYDIKRLGSIRNKFTNPAELIYNLERLDPHEFVYIDRKGRVPPVRSIVDRGRKVTNARG